jgi:hypothetical protein
MAKKRQRGACKPAFQATPSKTYDLHLRITSTYVGNTLRYAVGGPHTYALGHIINSDTQTRQDDQVVLVQDLALGLATGRLSAPTPLVVRFFCTEPCDSKAGITTSMVGADVARAASRQ